MMNECILNIRIYILAILLGLSGLLPSLSVADDKGFDVCAVKELLEKKAKERENEKSDKECGKK